MNELLLYLAVGVLCVLAIAAIVALSWLMDDRKHNRERRAELERQAWLARDWYQSPFKGHPHIRANRDREVV